MTWEEYSKGTWDCTRDCAQDCAPALEEFQVRDGAAWMHYIIDAQQEQSYV